VCGAPYLILRRVRLKILELWSGPVWYFVVLRCVGGGPASISALKVVAPFLLPLLLLLLLPRERIICLLGEGTTTRFDSIQTGIRLALSSRLTPQHPSVLAPNIDSTRLWATSHKKHFPSSSLCFSSSQPITSHQDQQQRTIPSITISTQQLHLA
jgi:hypothetical protein